MTPNAVTIEDLEALAQQVESEDGAERARLARLIAAYARIIAVRAPGEFREMPLERADEDGHYDNSYPPKQEFKDFNGPRLLMVREERHDQIATSRGFYHDWRAVQKSKGLYVRPNGGLMVCNISGSGEFGQFAAHPGNCNVQIAMDYQTAGTSDVSVGLLSEAELKLRDLAFPHVAALRERAKA